MRIKKYMILLLLSYNALIYAKVTRYECQSGYFTGSISFSESDTTPNLTSFLTEGFVYVVPHDVRIKNYFHFIDTVVRRLDPLVAYDLTGILIARANPWLIDTFMNTDYYIRKSRGEFVYDQRQLKVLRSGDILIIPDDSLAARIKYEAANTRLDINIPEFKLRILQGSDTLFTIPVRVGQNRKRYLESTGKITDLRTKTGSGKIVKVVRYPKWTDPVTMKPYPNTLRDDNKRTLMPQIPWLEPIIDGHRYGQMIHPTTNPESLGKTYSNGCIGTSEADAWRLYFMAPIGTKVTIRYDRKQVTPDGKTVWLKHVYDPKKYKLRE